MRKGKAESGIFRAEGYDVKLERKSYLIRAFGKHLFNLDLAASCDRADLESLPSPWRIAELGSVFVAWKLTV